MATLLTGRYIEIKMLPLSFKEYISAFEDKTDLSRKFRDYLRYSSFPQAVELLRRGYEVYIGKYDELEVDFVARKPENK